MLGEIIGCAALVTALFLAFVASRKRRFGPLRPHEDTGKNVALRRFALSQRVMGQFAAVHHSMGLEPIAAPARPVSARVRPSIEEHA